MSFSNSWLVVEHLGHTGEREALEFHKYEWVLMMPQKEMMQWLCQLRRATRLPSDKRAPLSVSDDGVNMTDTLQPCKGLPPRFRYHGT